MLIYLNLWRVFEENSSRIRVNIVVIWAGVFTRLTAIGHHRGLFKKMVIFKQTLEPKILYNACINA